MNIEKTMDVVLIECKNTITPWNDNFIDREIEWDANYAVFQLVTPDSNDQILDQILNILHLNFDSEPEIVIEVWKDTCGGPEIEIYRD